MLWLHITFTSWLSVSLHLDPTCQLPGILILLISLNFWYLLGHLYYIHRLFYLLLVPSDFMFFKILFNCTSSWYCLAFCWLLFLRVTSTYTSLVNTLWKYWSHLIFLTVLSNYKMNFEFSLVCFGCVQSTQMMCKWNDFTILETVRWWNSLLKFHCSNFFTVLIYIVYGAIFILFHRFCYMCWWFLTSSL